MVTYDPNGLPIDLRRTGVVYPHPHLPKITKISIKTFAQLHVSSHWEILEQLYRALEEVGEDEVETVLQS